MQHEGRQLRRRRLRERPRLHPTSAPSGDRCCPSDRTKAKTSECALSSTTGDAGNANPPFDGSTGETSTGDGQAPDGQAADGEAADGAGEASSESGAEGGTSGRDASDGATSDGATPRAPPPTPRATEATVPPSTLVHDAQQALLLVLAVSLPVLAVAAVVGHARRRVPGRLADPGSRRWRTCRASWRSSPRWRSSGPGWGTRWRASRSRCSSLTDGPLRSHRSRRGSQAVPAARFDRSRPRLIAPHHNE